MTDPTPAPPSWEQLLSRMADGPDPEPTVCGVLSHHDSTGSGPRSVGWISNDGYPPVFAGARLYAPDIPGDGVDPDSAAAAPGAGAENIGAHGNGDTSLPPLRVWRDGHRVRIEELDGTVTLIVGDEHCWQFDPDHPDPLQAPASTVRYQLSGTELLTRPDPDPFLNRDLGRPAGPVGATTFLHRHAWTVELAPHLPRSRGPVQLVVDAETGLILQRRNDALGSVSEWTQITVGEPLSADLFTWDGPARASGGLGRAPLDAAEADDARRRTEWFTSNVATLPLRVELTVGVWVHEYDEQTGAFQASFGEHHLGMIARRPSSAAGPWELGWDTPGRRWRDDRWEWAVRVYHDDLSDEAFDKLRSHLDAGPPPLG